MLPHNFKSFLLLLATAVSLLGCNNTPLTNHTVPINSAPGSEYLGVWESADAPSITLTITQRGDQFLIHTMELGGTYYIATVKNGSLQLNDGSGVFFLYHKDTDTITNSDNSQFLYRRKKK